MKQYLITKILTPAVSEPLKVGDFLNGAETQFSVTAVILKPVCIFI